MRNRVVAWLIFLAFLWGCYYLWSKWQSPFVGWSPIGLTSVMPRMPDGCAKRPECL